MSSPNETFHDSNEQTPLLADANDTTAGQAGKGTQKSFLPSILPWRGLAHGHCRPPKPPSTPPLPASGPPDASPAASGGGHSSTVNSSKSSRLADRPSDGPLDGTDGTDSAHGSPGVVDAVDAVNSATSGPWGDPAGLDMRRANDENVVLFREAVGIPTASTRPPTPSADASHRPARHDPESGGVPPDSMPTGIYARVIKEKKAKMWQASVLNGLLNACHVAQILVGAVLTTLGPSAQDHTVAITVLGATNTVLAGVFVLMKGQGLPGRLRKNAATFRRVQDWIEETDALLVAGVVGRDRRDVGSLVETAFQKYNAAVANDQATGWQDPTKQHLPDAANDVVARGMPSTPAPVPVPAGNGGSATSSPVVPALPASSSHATEHMDQDGNAHGTSDAAGSASSE
ncbi:uncharacterized protein SPSK_06360 [Sporothrix schenckii 1099-18]|uniref:SMODS and SLOG-associating 2TM effector domain-containing protein n=2 Tax=Sporothrix schenckii TaxID=29908 RepID=U7PKG2_SPOS1|nr:uncharacterized protein SPSK_06360 [Sporothrix schenckii 1099-18]ERS95229.1 hypothetical protein HMPREF1624_08441 [Sporothrix schenckii ATCC 58251]KJR90028.1 hypothetical protein SPSK_06360 [Sporothrix schenckii 1099-18]